MAAGLSLEEGDPVRAIASLEKTVRIDPGDIKTLRQLARLYEGVRNPKQALETWEKISQMSAAMNRGSQVKKDSSQGSPPISPQRPGIEGGLAPDMMFAFFFCLITFTIWYVTLMWHRVRLEQLRDDVAAIKERILG